MVLPRQLNSKCLKIVENKQGIKVSTFYMGAYIASLKSNRVLEK